MAVTETWVECTLEWAYWVNPETFQMPRVNERVPLGSVVIAKERVPGQRYLQIDYHRASEAGLESLDGKAAASAVLLEQMIVFMRDRGFPPHTSVKKRLKSGAVELSYSPSEYDRFTLKLTEELLGEPVQDFLDGLEEPEDGVNDDWCIEAAKSGRAKCRSCSEKIAAGELRLGEKTEYEGRISYRWHHLECAQEEVRDLTKIKGYGELDDDQRASLEPEEVSKEPTPEPTEPPAEKAPLKKAVPAPTKSAHKCVLKVKAHDLLWATWLERKPLKTRPLPFKPEDLWAMKFPFEYRKWTELVNKSVPFRISFEEALFWLVNPWPKPDTRELHMELWEKHKNELSYPLTMEQFANVVEQQLQFREPRMEQREGVAPFYKTKIAVKMALLSVEDFRQTLSGGGGYLVCVWPFLTQKELESLREFVRPKLKTPDGRDAEAYAHWALAGTLGMHEEVEKVVESWEDRDDIPLSDFTAAVMILGQSSPQKIHHAFSRLNLNPALCGSEYGTDHDDFGRRYLACTQDQGLDIMVTGVNYAATKKEAKRRFRLLAMVLSPANVRPMLEIAEESEVPDMAQKWLMKHHEFTMPEMQRLVAEGDDYASTAEEILEYLGV